MTSQEPIKLYFIAGFLGSGKTTLMNNLLDYLAEIHEKAGVIVNEWGQVGVDGSLIHDHGFEIKELNNGQIFCSCLSGSFVEALAQFAHYPLEYLLVEASGLANPASLKQMLQDIEQLTGSSYDYRGMITIVDPECFLDLVEDVNAVEEQVISSQFVIINKIDLVDETTLNQVRKKVKELNPEVPLIETRFSEVEGIFELDLMDCKENESILRKVKTPYKRPNHYVLTTSESIKPESARDFARAISDSTFRIKGFVHDDEQGWFYLDGVNNTVQISPFKTKGDETKIIIISNEWEKILPKIEAAWHENCGVDFVLS